MSFRTVSIIFIMLLLGGCTNKSSTESKASKKSDSKQPITLVATKNAVTIANKTNNYLTVVNDPVTKSTAPVKEMKTSTDWHKFNAQKLDTTESTSTGLVFSYTVNPHSNLKISIDTKLYKIPRNTLIRYKLRVKRTDHPQTKKLISNSIKY